VDLPDLSDDRMTLFVLKEKAKWSSDSEGKKAAIKKLSTLGEDAISELQEIMSITAYEDIKNACAEAIKSMHATSSSITKGNNHSSSSISASQNNTGLNILFDSAREYYVRGDYKNADIFFERVLEIDPNHIEALNSKGILWYRLADYDKARNCFEKVLQVDPKNMLALNNIEILNKKKDEDTRQQKERPAAAPSADSSSQQKERPAAAPSADSSSQQKERPAAAPSADSSRTTPRADPRNPYNDPTLPGYNPNLGKKKEDASQQQVVERPAASPDSGTIPRADPRNPYNDPTLPYYNPDLDKKNN
jgi:tetratricopeptide (TPR) repeat protein